ncbi:MAG: CBS domain-containing protein [Thermoplasmata archaeon]
MSMVRNALKNLFSKPATRRYPAEPVVLPKGERGRVVYDMSKCIFCGLCEKRCPTNAITMDKANKRQSVSRAKCIACGVCVESCPTDAIEMRPEYAPPALAPEVHVYDAKLTPHQFTVASLPPFERARVGRPEPVSVPPATVPAEGVRPREGPLRGVLDEPARTIMSRPVLTLFEDDTVRKAVQVMVANHVDGLPVVDINLKVLGIVTGTDIARDVGREKDGILGLLFPRIGKREDRDGEERLKKTMSKPVYEVMSSPAVTADEEAPLSEIVALMDKNRFNRVPIVDSSGRLSGIITRRDILRAISRSVESQEKA